MSRLVNVQLVMVELLLDISINKKHNPVITHLTIKQVTFLAVLLVHCHNIRTYKQMEWLVSYVCMCVYDLFCNKGPFLPKYLWPNLWKGTTVKILQKHFCIHTVSVDTYQLYVYKTVLRCFNSGPFWQIWSNVLPEVVPYQVIHTHTHMCMLL